MIEAMHRDGARVFVEVGPASILTPLIESILKDRPHLAVACDPPGSSGLAAWLAPSHAWLSAGVPLSLEPLTAGRSQRVLDLEHLPAGETPSRPLRRPGLSTAVAPARWLSPSRRGWARRCRALAARDRVAERRVSANGSHGTEQRQRCSPSSPQRRTLASQRAEIRRTEPTVQFDRLALPLATKRQPGFTYIHEKLIHTTELDRPGHRVVPADHAGVPGSAEVDDARVPRRAGRVRRRRAARPARERRTASEVAFPSARPPRLARAPRNCRTRSPAASPASDLPTIMRPGRPAARHHESNGAHRRTGNGRSTARRAEPGGWARIARRSPPGCSRPSAIGPATRSRPWGSTSTWKPTWESTRSSGSRSWGSCAT